MSSTPQLILYSYWRSSAAWRVRIGLHFKGLPFDYKAVNLIEDGGQQFKPEYEEKNPMALVPSLQVGDKVLAESVAILEYLDEAYPDTPRLLPSDPFQKAIVREVVNIIACDIHPIQNLRVVTKLNKEYGVDRTAWAAYWINRGFTSLEKVLTKCSGKYAVGDSITLADCLLVPQALTAAARYGVNLDSYPIIKRVSHEASQLESFKKAEPSVQPDATL